MLIVISFVPSAQTNEKRHVNVDHPYYTTLEDIDSLKAALHEFEEYFLQCTNGKSEEEITRLYRDSLFYDLVELTGMRYFWPLDIHYEYQEFLFENGLGFLENKYLIDGLPDDNDITEAEAISIAKEGIALRAEISPDALDEYIMFTTFTKSVNPPSDYEWGVYFIVETPRDGFPYRIVYCADIDRSTGEISSILPFDGNY